MIIELVGNEAPGTNAIAATLEPRVSPRNVALYKDTSADAVHMLYATSVSRATTNMTAVHKFYTDVLQATLVDSADVSGASRRCYKWGTAKSDVCFVQRTDSSNYPFTVKAMEQMLWGVHAKNLVEPTDGDKYNDNHFAADLQISGDYIVTYMDAHNPYPLSTSSWWGYACDQSYLIDPTGWTIQTDLSFTSSYPGCTESKAKATKKVAAPAARKASTCPGGQLTKCLELCPSAPKTAFKACVESCTTRCAAEIAAYEAGEAPHRATGSGRAGCHCQRAHRPACDARAPPPPPAVGATPGGGSCPSRGLRAAPLRLSFAPRCVLSRTRFAASHPPAASARERSHCRHKAA
eukprot:7378270-Prymnesium_polylepis.1